MSLLGYVVCVIAGMVIMGALDVALKFRALKLKEEHDKELNGERLLCNFCNHPVRVITIDHFRDTGFTAVLGADKECKEATHVCNRHTQPVYYKVRPQWKRPMDEIQ